MSNKKRKKDKIVPKRLTQAEHEAQRQEMQKLLGKDLLKRRDLKGLSQKQFVLASGMVQSTASAIELGNSNVTLDSLVRIGRMYHISVVTVLRDKVFRRKL